MQIYKNKKKSFQILFVMQQNWPNQLREWMTFSFNYANYVNVEGIVFGLNKTCDA